MRLVLCSIVEEFDFFRFSSIMSDRWSKRSSNVRLRSIDYAGVVSRPFVLSLNNLKPPKKKEVKTPLYKKSLYFVVNFYTKYKAVIIQEKFILRLTFNPVLAFTIFRTTGPTLMLRNWHMVNCSHLLTPETWVVLGWPCSQSFPS